MLWKNKVKVTRNIQRYSFYRRHFTVGASPGELSAAVGTGNQRGLGILWKASVLDLSHAVNWPCCLQAQPDLGLWHWQQIKVGWQCWKCSSDPAKCKGSWRRADFTGKLGKSSAPCWIREGINPCTRRRKSMSVCAHTCTYASLKSPKQRAVPLKYFLLSATLCSLIPFKANLAVVPLKTIPILCCLPHTRSTPFLSNSCLTSQLVPQKLSSQLPDISIQGLPWGAAAHFHVGLAFVFVL